MVSGWFLDNGLGWQMVGGGKGEGGRGDRILFVSEDGAGEKEGGHAGAVPMIFLIYNLEEVEL